MATSISLHQQNLQLAKRECVSLSINSQLHLTKTLPSVGCFSQYAPVVSPGCIVEVELEMRYCRLLGSRKDGAQWQAVLSNFI